MDRIDPADLALLDRFQRDLPLVSQPFAVLGHSLGLPEAEVIDRLAKMQAAPSPRQIGRAHV